MKKLFGVYFLLVSLLFFSCKSSESSKNRIYLDNSLYWSICQKDSRIENADDFSYTKLESLKYRNISNLIGTDGKYIWIKADFSIPEDFVDLDMGLFIPYVHFADKVYCNGEFIGEYGNQDDNLFDTAYVSQSFFLPNDLLKSNEKNTIYIKLFALGQATLEEGVFVGTWEDVKLTEKIMTFARSKSYIFPAGGIVIAALAYLVLFCTLKRKKLYTLYFSLCNIFICLYVTTFFANDLIPLGYTTVYSFLTYIKIARCFSFEVFVYFLIEFSMSFLEIKRPKIINIIRLCILFVSYVLVFIPQDYLSLAKVCPYVLTIQGIDIAVHSFIVIYSMITKKRRKLAISLAVGEMPIFFTLLFDLITKEFMENILIPYISIFGLILTILIFFFYLTREYSQMVYRVESFNTELEKEVAIKTENLSHSNKLLKNEIERSERDLATAALVQQKFFHTPEQEFLNWDIAVLYKPLATVSGDFFDFYSDGKTLDGMSLFDASGHGVAASLVTMLSKNLIFHSYSEIKQKGISISDALSRINERFIDAKGDIENYITGLLLNFINDKTGTCKVQLSNAGHPAPLLYHFDEQREEELLPFVTDICSGPVGIKGFDVKYSSLEFEMKENDFLILFTDGLLESMNKNRESFGVNRVKKVMQENSSESAIHILNEIMNSLNSFIEYTPHEDDITIIVLKRTK